MLLIGLIVLSAVSIGVAGIQWDVANKEKAKRIEAERKMNQIIREREEEIMYDLRTRDQDNIPDDEEWIARFDGMPDYRNIPDEWRGRE